MSIQDHGQSPHQPLNFRRWTRAVHGAEDNSAVRQQTPFDTTHKASLEGYGHSINLLAYLRMMLSSAKMKRDLLTVRQFCRWGTGLYRAMVRALCALACFRDTDIAAAAASCASPPPRSGSPSPESTVLGADSSPNRAILQRDEDTASLERFLVVVVFFSPKNEFSMKEK